jgi:hypothetical protein
LPLHRHYAAISLAAADITPRQILLLFAAAITLSLFRSCFLLLFRRLPCCLRQIFILPSTLPFATPCHDAADYCHAAITLLIRYAMIFRYYTPRAYRTSVYEPRRCFSFSLSRAHALTLPLSIRADYFACHASRTFA